MASKCFEPPAFISKTKTYSTYKADLRRWSRITSVEKKLQAEVVVYNLEGHSSGIKEKIEVKIGTELENNEDGIERLLKFLDTIYQTPKNSPNYKGKKNSLGANGKVLTCYKCQSEYHFADKCDKKNIKKEDESKKPEEGAMVTAIVKALKEASNTIPKVTMVCDVVTKETSRQEGGEVNDGAGGVGGEVASRKPYGGSYGDLTQPLPTHSGNPSEFVMVVEREENLCLMVEEAGD